MQKLKLSLILIFCFITLSASATTPNIIIRRQDSPFATEMDIFLKFERSLTQSAHETQQKVRWSVEKDEKLQIKQIQSGKTTITKYTIVVDAGVLPPKGYPFPQKITFVGYYEILANRVQGYCLLEPLFKETNPEIESLTDWPADNYLLSLLDLKGRPIQVNAYAKRNNGNVETYLTAELFGKKMLLLDCLMSEKQYQKIQSQVAKELSSLLDFYFHFFNIFA
jgi:hypothetical protein